MATFFVKVPFSQRSYCVQARLSDTISQLVALARSGAKISEKPSNLYLRKETGRLACEDESVTLRQAGLRPLETLYLTGEMLIGGASVAPIETVQPNSALDESKKALVNEVENTPLKNADSLNKTSGDEKASNETRPPSPVKHTSKFPFTQANDIEAKDWNEEDRDKAFYERVSAYRKDVAEYKDDEEFVKTATERW